MQYKMIPPPGVIAGGGANGVPISVLHSLGYALVDKIHVASLTAQGWVDDSKNLLAELAAQDAAIGDVTAITDPVTGGIEFSIPGGVTVPVSSLSRSENKIVLMGDSITLRNQQGTTANFHTEGYFVVANMLMQNKFDLIGIYATSGYTIEQIAATHLPSVLASGANNCFVLAGTNNATDTDAATIFGKLSSLLLSPLFAAGINVTVGTIPPNNTWTATQSAKMAAVNDLIRSAQSTWPGLRVADLWAATVNSSTGAPKSGLFGDGIHPSARGAMYFARAIDDAMGATPTIKTARVSGGVLDPYVLTANPLANGNNASGTNGASIGTGGTGTGPNQWTVQSNNAATTFTCSGNNARIPADQIDGKALTIAATYGADDHYIQVGPMNGADIYLARAWAATTAKVAGTLVTPTAGRGAGWQFIAVSSGATGGSEPVWPTALGGCVTDGSVTWMAIKDLAAGDIYQFEVELVFSALSGYVCPQMRVNFDTAAYDGSLRPSVIANGSAVVSGDANAYSPTLALATNFFDYVPLNAPLVLRSQPIIVPSGVVSHVGPILRLYGKNATTATFNVQRMELRRIG